MSKHKVLFRTPSFHFPKQQLASIKFLLCSKIADPLLNSHCPNLWIDVSVMICIRFLKYARRWLIFNTCQYSNSWKMDKRFIPRGGVKMPFVMFILFSQIIFQSAAPQRKGGSSNSATPLKKCFTSSRNGWPSDKNSRNSTYTVLCK